MSLGSVWYMLSPPMWSTRLHSALVSGAHVSRRTQSATNKAQKSCFGRKKCLLFAQYCRNRTSELLFIMACCLFSGLTRAAGDRWQIVSFCGESTTWGNCSAILHVHRKTSPQQNISWCFSKSPPSRKSPPFPSAAAGRFVFEKPTRDGAGGGSLCACVENRNNSARLQRYQNTSSIKTLSISKKGRGKQHACCFRVCVCPCTVSYRRVVSQHMLENAMQSKLKETMLSHRYEKQWHSKLSLSL